MTNTLDSEELVDIRNHVPQFFGESQRLSLSGNIFFLSDNDISLSDNNLSQSVNDISLSGNKISLTGNEISHTTRRNLATTGTKDVPKYCAIFCSKISLKFAEISRFSLIIVFITFAQYCNISLKVSRRQK